MPNIWRSEKMQLVQLYIPSDVAHEVVDELGKLGLFQFRDLNQKYSAFQRNFAADIRKCDDMERKLRFFQDEIEKLGVKRNKESQESKSSMQSKFSDPPIMVLEGVFNDLEKDLVRMNSNLEDLRRSFRDLVELSHVLRKAQEIFSTTNLSVTPMLRATPDVDIERAARGSGRSQLGFLSGVLPREKRAIFERLCFRALRGNIVMRFKDIDDPMLDEIEGERTRRTVAIVFIQGQRARDKVCKICEAFGVRQYRYPEDSVDRELMLKDTERRIVEMRGVLEQTYLQRKALLSDLGDQLYAWTARVVKEKAIAHTMNLFEYDRNRKVMIAEGWCPVGSSDLIRTALQIGARRSGSAVECVLTVIASSEQPPTYFITNKFTSAFQAIVDAYGIPRYQEINPTPLTIITFPFLFAFMFADSGHGLLLFLLALFFVIRESSLSKTKLNEFAAICFDGRYLLLLSGFFSIYNGLIFNETFGLPFDFFRTSYKFISKGDSDVAICAPSTDSCRTYVFGVDPIWAYAHEDLLVNNSIKMKLSIIFGVIQMITGIILSLFNAIYFKSYINIFFEFLPQMIYFLSLFGYLCVMIVIKWLTDWKTVNRQPPDLIHTMINMFLRPGTLEDPPLFPGQALVQPILLGLAIISIFWMLFPKPLILRYRHRRKAAAAFKYRDLEKLKPSDKHEEFEFSEVFIHQLIHTIEFVLGGVSNTASYLRLWALSLAHEELSSVFLERVLIAGIQTGSPVAIVVAFAVWFAATVFVLIIMEGLSSCLHALRLHWVEFQNKFYAGDGYKFEPFSYATLSTADDDKR
mmetsp:Transcript_32873/g.55468  ORF Transcript_32873/g.55468 Transcript_32873/m.55468 type:complete len:805 (-) Transcript_32873:455-2869(-)|eukprot:CAMPEP_0184335332 /NCGR_PEP_ID=MMETSP1089-20130417/3906_1 /TAXON_ID=38269 ORGANISM="Gloeochaete wittrockiana, Strain SAG46.84" /NCGR_SAMPLE_ID=MMETSP1089 /ASSEMBLY_ACC=CAM_ASM_000445 /LENGTH=804 /DNA_ID=CAMNT_0026659931 /DNA_START=55 /DNA_END=2469 /DNA_ORIENTATION=-